MEIKDPQAPGTNGWETPEVPDEPELPLVPDEPEVPSIPLVPDVPSIPLVPDEPEGPVRLEVVKLEPSE